MKDRSKTLSLDTWRDPTHSLTRLKSVESQLVALFDKYTKALIAELKPPADNPFHTQKEDAFTIVELGWYFKRMEALTKIHLTDPANAILDKEINDAYLHGKRFADLQLKPIGIVLGAPLAVRQAEAKKIGILVEKAKGEFKGVSDATNQKIRRVISNGMVNEDSYGNVVKGIQDAATGIGENRARMIARTETMKAINEAAKDRYDEADIEQFERVECEDERTCEYCSSIDGNIYSRDEADQIDADMHPDCRGTWVPAPDVPSTQKKADKLQPLKDLDRPRDLQHVEDVYPDARACPFPYLDDRPDPGKIIEGKVTHQEVDLKTLYAGQMAVSKKQVKHILKKIERGEYGTDEKYADKIIVVHHAGKHFIWAGHHHATALLLSGAKEAPVVHHIELEKGVDDDPIKQKRGPEQIHRIGVI